MICNDIVTNNMKIECLECDIEHLHCLTNLCYHSEDKDRCYHQLRYEQQRVIGRFLFHYERSDIDIEEEEQLEEKKARSCYVLPFYN